MRINRIIIPIILILFQTSFLKAQNKAIVIEAESGNIGTDWIKKEIDTIGFVSTITSGKESSPMDTSRIITYNIIFPVPGVYKLYAKVRINTDSVGGGSFFYINKFGDALADADSTWIPIDNLQSKGYSQPYNFITNRGNASSGEWKWINLSEYFSSDEPILFEVNEDSLSQVFQVAAGEIGLDIDKFAFGKSDLYYTVSFLENGNPGVHFPEDKILPIAFGQSKFIGNVYSSAQLPGFAKYWNQVTPENAGKWGSVERSRDIMNWATLDKAYKLARDNNMPFKLHVLVWGNQQPSWIENLNAPEQREEIREWFNAVANRYPDIEYVEVVNEPLHDPPNQPGNGGGNYFKALGGSGTTGWDWIIKAFKYARNSFPNARLMINEYGIVNSTENTEAYVEIIELLKKDSLIDAIGVQAHAFSLIATPAAIRNNLDKLAATGLPIFVTELDIDGKTNNYQLMLYQRLFPVFWEHPSVQGITLWGYRPGMWRTDEKAYLINTANKERPALIWLRKYVDGSFKKVNSITISAPDDNAVIDTDNGTLQLTATLSPEDPTFPKINWSVIETELATIDENGLLTAIKNGTVTVMAQATDGYGKTNYFRVSIINQIVTKINNHSLADKEIKVFPNPSINGNFTISGLQKIKQIKIFAVDGSLVTQLEIKNKDQVSYNSDINRGIYLIQMSDGLNIFVRKLIVD